MEATYMKYGTSIRWNSDLGTYFGPRIKDKDGSECLGDTNEKFAYAGCSTSTTIFTNYS
jgi:hypothetical protein